MVDSCIEDCLFGRGHTHGNSPRNVLAVFGFNMRGLVEIRRLTRDLHLHSRGVETCNAPHTALTEPGGLPEILPACPVWTYCTNSRHDHSMHLCPSVEPALHPGPRLQYRLQQVPFAFRTVRHIRLREMDAVSPPLKLRHALAGLEAGVLGALLMLASVMLGASFDRHSIWVVPNLFATTFYGSDAYQNEFFRDSWAGLALLIAIYGLLGVVWGCVWREQSKRGLAIYGVVTGIVVYFVFFHLIWNHINGLIVLYAPDRQLAFGHVLWGWALSKSPVFAQRIADESSRTVEPPPSPSGSQSGEEIQTGEVIT